MGRAEDRRRRKQPVRRVLFPLSPLLPQPLPTPLRRPRPPRRQFPRIFPKQNRRGDEGRRGGFRRFCERRTGIVMIPRARFVGLPVGIPTKRVSFFLSPLSFPFSSSILFTPFPLPLPSISFFLFFYSKKILFQPLLRGASCNVQG